MSPLIHPRLQPALEALRTQLPQSLLISGENGTGLLTIAVWLAGKNLARTLMPKNTKGEDDTKGTIVVEAIRQLYEQTRSTHNQKRVIIIDNAERMSVSAQAAFLKLLEEPNRFTHFILTSHQPNILAATIRSRTQHVQISRISSGQTQALLDAQSVTDPIKRQRLLFLAGGRPAELLHLISDDAYFEQKASYITDARQFIQTDTYGKLLIAHRYRTDRDSTLELIDSALILLQTALRQQPQPAIVQQITTLLRTRESIAGNGNVALQLAAAVV
jgi:hypothetical protein